MQFTIRMPDEYGEKIALLAEKMGLKKSDIARIALKKFVEISDQHVPYLLRKAQRIEDYLRQR